MPWLTHKWGIKKLKSGSSRDLCFIVCVIPIIEAGFYPSKIVIHEVFFIEMCFNTISTSIYLLNKSLEIRLMLYLLVYLMSFYGWTSTISGRDNSFIPFIKMPEQKCSRVKNCIVHPTIVWYRKEELPASIS